MTLLLVFYFEVGIWGLWTGPSIACAVNTIAYLAIFVRTDWPQLIERSRAQRHKDTVVFQAANDDDHFEKINDTEENK